MRDALAESRTDLSAVEEYPIATRAAHARTIAKLFSRFALAAALSFFVMGGTALAMTLSGASAKAIVEVQLIVVYIVLPVYAIGYVAPILASSLIKMSLGVEMSRRALELGKETAAILRALQREVMPVLSDTKTVIDSVKGLIDDLKKQDVGKILKFIEKIRDDGTVEKIAVSLDEIGRKVGETIRKAERNALDREIEKL